MPISDANDKIFTGLRKRKRGGGAAGRSLGPGIVSPKAGVSLFADKIQNCY
jgi:hypothetical protein